MGLGLSKTIKKYRVAYPSEGLIDWVELGFTRHEIAEAFPNPAETIVNLEARPLVRRHVAHLFEEIDLVVCRLRRDCTSELRRLYIHWLAVRLLC